MSRWARKRQYSYILGLFLIFAVVLIIIFVTTRPEPNCFDGLQNQGELGVDCGNVCEAICPNEPIPLKIIWSRVIRVSDGVYDIASLVENTNTAIGVSKLSYIYRLVDKENLLIGFRPGQTYANPAEQFLIFEPNVSSGEREASRVFVELSPLPVWERVGKSKEEILVLEKSFTNEPKPRLEVSIANRTLEDIDQVEVGAVLADENGNTITVSRTFVDNLAKGETRLVFFTWPTPFEKEPVIFDIYPRASVF